MSEVRLWDKERLRTNDLPSLQEVLDTCDRSLLKRVVLEDFVCRGSQVDDERSASMHRRLDASLDTMVALDVERKPNRGWVMVPQETYVLDARRGTIAWRLHAALVPLLGAAAVERRLKILDGCTASFAHAKKADKHLRSLVDAEAGKRAKGPFADDRGERSYALAPWEETLACKVWLGGDWCCRERYLIVASAFWEMTFFGFEYDKAQARMAQEKAVSLTDPAVGSDGAVQDAGAARTRKTRPATLGLQPLDPFDSDARKRLAGRVAVLNHNARYAFYERQLDLARRLGKE